MGDRKQPNPPPSERSSTDPVSRQIKPTPPLAPLLKNGDLYRAALDDAIAEFRGLTDELVEKEKRFRSVRAAIVALSTYLGMPVPGEVMAALDKRTVATRIAVKRAARAAPGDGTP